MDEFAYERQRREAALRRRRRLLLAGLILICAAILTFCGLRIAALLGGGDEPDEGGSAAYDTPPSEKPSVSPSSEPSKEPEPSALPETALPWYLTLVNRDNPLPEDYEIELTTLSNGQSVDTRIYPALQQMFDDMRADEVYPTVASGFRTREKQQSLMDEKIQEYINEGYERAEAEAEAALWVAKPGTSEHELGLSVDINADGVHSAGSDVYDWLAENAYKYGFIQRYPAEKTDITGISNEPWHYRYVGEDDAAAIYAAGLCLEEYLELYEGE